VVTILVVRILNRTEFLLVLTLAHPLTVLLIQRHDFP